MIQVGTESIEPGIHVVIWLRQAVGQPPRHRDEFSPAERLVPALRAASAEDRDLATRSLFDALEESDDTFRMHILYSLHGFTTEALVDRYLDLLPPSPARWLITPRNSTDAAVPELVFRTIESGAGGDERLKAGMLALGNRVLSHERLLSYCVTNYPHGEGIDMIRRHLEAGEQLDEANAQRLGMRFARDAPEYLDELATRLRQYPRAVRVRFVEGVSRHVPDDRRVALSTALCL
ncbi:MAG: hypothetical protein AB8G14_16980 [Ilumatobacter sp.]